MYVLGGIPQAKGWRGGRVDQGNGNTTWRMEIFKDFLHSPDD